jgi:hypothetical protein
VKALQGDPMPAQEPTPLNSTWATDRDLPLQVQKKLQKNASEVREAGAIGGKGSSRSRFVNAPGSRNLVILHHILVLLEKSFATISAFGRLATKPPANWEQSHPSHSP